MRILLINSNTFKKPPCIPVGLEYVASGLENAGHEVELFDMFHYDSPIEELGDYLRREQFDLAGITVRNIDTAQAARYSFFIPAIRLIVDVVHKAGLKAVLGGIGFSAMPEEILAYTGADHGIVGPAELVFPGFCKGFAGGVADAQPRIVDARGIGIDPDMVPLRGRHAKFEPYIQQGGVVGFATQYGCTERCLYCTEAGTPLLKRSPRAVGEEMRQLRSIGCTEFHLCDSEFNQDVDFCLEVLDEIEKNAPGIRWSLYMKPLPFKKELGDALRRAGANMVTLSVDSAVASARGGRYGWEDVEVIVNDFRERGIRLAIDLSCGLPDEPAESVAAAIEFFRNNRPELVNVNTWFRVYGGTGLEALLRRRPDLHEHLSAPLPDGAPLEKLFFNAFSIDRLKELIGDDPMFKLEGFDPGTNYEILR